MSCFHLHKTFRIIITNIHIVHVFSKIPSPMTQKLFLFLAIALNITQVTSLAQDELNFTSINGKCSYDREDFDIISKAIEEGLKFFEKHLDIALLDACMGSRGAQAQIRLVLNSNRSIPQVVRTRLELIQELAESVSSRIIRNVIVNPLIPLLEKSHTLPWVRNVSLWMQPGIDEWKSSDIMTSSEVKNYTSALEYFQGTKSNTCINQVFTCETENITQECYEYMISKPRYLYTLNHQVIYMLIAKQRKCEDFPNFRGKFPNQDPDLFLQDLCSKVWFSARRVDQYNFFFGVRDLFTEQVGLCSMAGYPNFLRKDWLHMILSWQTSSGIGCFLDPASYVTLRPLYARNTTDVPGNELILRGSDPPTLRVKRTEVSIKSITNEKCYVHFTAVGIIALSIHLRHLIETCYT